MLFKNEKKMAYLSREARNNPAIWVVDKYDYKKEEFNTFIDWYKPSKDRLNALHLESFNVYIYVDDETYMNDMRDYWKRKQSEKRERERTISLDYLQEKNNLELDENLHLLTKDNYYLYDSIGSTDDNLAKKKKLVESKIRKELGTKFIPIFRLYIKGYKWNQIALEVKISKSTMEIKKKKLLEFLDKFH